jgi:hypothetical protein
MAENRDFQDKQYAFAAHIRDPEHRPAPDNIEDRRMSIYRNLFFNNLRNLLARNFPVLRKLHSDADWDHFIREFMKVHQSKTPYFLQLPEEFLAFLTNEYEHRDCDFPFLNELAHYEYVELALSISTDENNLEGVDPNGNLLTEMPVKSALTWVFAYHFPVHRISKEFTPGEASEQPVYLAVYRQADDKVGFLELNPIAAGLLNAIEENTDHKNGDTMLRELAAAISYSDVDAFIQHGAATLTQMRQLEILTGTRSA